MSIASAKPPESEKREFVLRLSIPENANGQAYRHLRQALKHLLRAWGIRCIEAREDG